MTIGIMVTTDRHLRQVCGITRAAIAKGHAVEIFATDDGVKLLADHRFSSLSALPGVRMSFCEHSAQHRGGSPAGLPEAVVSGSQFQNAIMVSESDRVVVL